MVRQPEAFLGVFLAIPKTVKVFWDKPTKTKINSGASRSTRARKCSLKENHIPRIRDISDLFGDTKIYPQKLQKNFLYGTI